MKLVGTRSATERRSWERPVRSASVVAPEVRGAEVIASVDEPRGHARIDVTTPRASTNERPEHATLDAMPRAA
jgi:hypothetical protein